MDSKQDWGLVLAGGGGKGAYEIGAWKALREKKNLNISAVSGTSVGALNAALFSAGNYEKAKEIWEKQINEEVILSPNFFKKKDVLKRMEDMLKETREWEMELPDLAVSLSWLVRQAAKRGAFTRKGLIQIIRQNGILPEVQKSNIPCYAACYNLTKKKVEYFLLQQKKPREILEILLASSALPFIFPPEEMYGMQYWDGGLQDNVPIQPLYEAGYRKILIIHLDEKKTGNFFSLTKFMSEKNPFIADESSEYQDATLIHFYPQKSLSGFLGTLDFKPKTIQRKINQGYMETKKYLEQHSLHGSYL